MDHNKIINQELVGGALDKTQLHWGQPNNTKLPLIDLTRWPAPLFVISLSHFCNLLGTKATKWMLCILHLQDYAYTTLFLLFIIGAVPYQNWISVSEWIVRKLRLERKLWRLVEDFNEYEGSVGDCTWNHLRRDNEGNPGDYHKQTGWQINLE